MIHNVYGGFKEKKPREFDDVSPTIRTPKGGGHIPMVLQHSRDGKGKLRGYNEREIAGTLTAPSGNQENYVSMDTRIRTFTPLECERLQGFPDNWTRYGIMNGKKVLISDSQRYKMMGNAVTVKVVRAIREGIIGVWNDYRTLQS